MPSTIGSDPELLLYSEGLQMYVPSIGLLGGTKTEPFQVPNGAVQEDNVTAEFNIDPVSIDDTAGFIANIKSVRQYLDNMVAPHGLVSRVESSAKYDAGFLDHPQAMASGCDPDINVYSMSTNNYPDIKSSDIRCAGGHIHFGSDDLFLDPGTRENFIKYCDYYIGAPLSVIDPDTERKKTYGAAGNFRYKPYGVEYRTPSNVWLQSDECMEFVVRGLKRAENAVRNGNRIALSTAEQILRTSISDDPNTTYDVLDRVTRSELKRLP